MTRDRIMLGQFCLYGFLKNQQYFEPFLLLALLEKLNTLETTLALTWVGVLYGFRDICVNLMEVPSGAIADVLGRRRCMITSFVAYIGSFLIFGLAEPIWTLFAAMFLYAVGDAFRTGTHKAMIFTWLARNGRQSEKTAVYGLTRSYSKLGSAVSALIAAALVFWSGQYHTIFLFCIGPYVLNIINFLLYPKYLDGDLHAEGDLKAIFATFWHSIRDCLRRGPLRRLVIEAASYEGLFKSSKDYLQLIVKGAAIAWLLPYLKDYFEGTDAEVQKLCTPLLIGPVYFVLFLASSLASRRAKDLARRAGGEEAAARWLWTADLAAFAGLAVAVILHLHWLAILAFVVMFVLENFWRPILVARFADHAAANRQATILSVESQASSLAVAVVAPALGFSIDMMRRWTGSEESNFLPLAALGMIVTGLILLTGKRRRLHG